MQHDEENFQLYIAERRDHGFAAAAEFYRISLFEVAITAARRNASADIPQYELVVVPLGLSPEAAAVTIAGLAPLRAHIIATELSRRDSFSALQKMLEGRVELTAEVVDSNDTASIYRAVNRSGESAVGLVAVAIAGGRNAMVAAMSAAADMLEYDIWYLDGEATPAEPNVPTPWTQALIFLQPPIRVVGDVIRGRAWDAFDAERFADARSRFDQLYRRTGIASDRLAAEVSAVYEAFARYDHAQVLARIEPALAVAAQTSPDIENSLGRLAKLSRLLLGVGSGVTAEALDGLTGWLATRTRSSFDRSDLGLATLLGYRTLEAIAQRRCLEHGISIGARWDDIDVELRKAHERRFGRYGAGERMHVGLRDRWQLLFLLGDPSALPPLNLRDFDELRDIRNSAYFAHGLSAPSRGSVREIVKTVERLIALPVLMPNVLPWAAAARLLKSVDLQQSRAASGSSQSDQTMHKKAAPRVRGERFDRSEQDVSWPS